MNGVEQRKLVAIMFTDMVGYSALAQRNEALALELLEEHRRLLRPIFPEHNGREVETAGDAFLVEFVSALEAVRCGVDIQQRLSDRNRISPPERAIRLRIGIHVGDVVHKDGKLMGDAVNIAARIEPLAAAGGICISSAVHEQVRNKLSLPMAALGPAELKNIELAMVVHRVMMPWESAVPDVARFETSPPAQPRSLQWAVSSAVVFVLCLGAAGWWVNSHRQRPADPANAPITPRNEPVGRITSLAVKPLDDFSGDTNNAYLSDGMTEALCAALGNVSALRVPGRSSVMRFKGGQKSIHEIAKELNVEAIVEGSIQRAANRVLITVQLIESRTDRHLWATNYERDLSDFFKVQSEVAQTIAGEIKVRLTSEDRARLATARSANPEAVAAYLQGRYHWHRRTADDIRKAVQLLERAVQLDPTYAQSHAGLADAYLVMVSRAGGSLKEWYPKARTAAVSALDLDPRLGEPHATLGVIKGLLEWDWAAAEQEFRDALRLNPGYATAHQWYGTYLLTVGRLPEAIAECKRAMELDPASAIARVDYSVVLSSAGLHDEAIAAAKTAMELAPDLIATHSTLVFAYLMKGSVDQASAALEKNALGANRDTRGDRAWIFARSGRIEEARQLVRQLEAERIQAPFSPALYASLGEKDKAFELLNRDLEEQLAPVTRLKRFPLFDVLRSDSRYAELLKKMRLDK